MEKGVRLFGPVAHNWAALAFNRTWASASGKRNDEFCDTDNIFCFSNFTARRARTYAPRRAYSHFYHCTEEGQHVMACRTTSRILVQAVNKPS